MWLKCSKTGVLLVSILLLVLVTPNSFASNYELTYNSQVQFGLANHELYVYVPSSLHNYYSGKPHRIMDSSEYSKFVTPDAVAPIAESLRTLTVDSIRNDEDFANAVLAMVHQIPYTINGLKYPVETLVDNSGKCDTLSLLAASIMKAGGLDVVLLYFTQAHHINIGVHLPYEPRTSWWWLPPTGYDFDGKKYWIAECTSAMQWRVGDIPPNLASEQPWIIPLDDSEPSSPGRVSSKVGGSLSPSTISINLSSTPSDGNQQEQVLSIYGAISPAFPNEPVSVYFSQDGIAYIAYKTETDEWGNYSFNWNLTSTGTYYIRTSWSGNAAYAGADSEVLTVFLGFPQSLVQFKGPGYYYTYGRAYVASYELRVRRGVEDFLNVELEGQGILLTGEFIVVKSGQIITAPQIGETIQSLKSRVVPKGMQPLRLPNDIEQTTNNQFSFVLRNNDVNSYSLNVRSLNYNDMAKIAQIDGNGTTLINTSEIIEEDTWYKVVARISQNEITSELQDNNGTILERFTTTDTTNVSELIVLLANNTDRAVAFRNLNVETLYSPTQIPKDPPSDEKNANGGELLALYLNLGIFAVATVIAIIHVTRRRKVQKPAQTQNWKITFKGCK